LYLSRTSLPTEEEQFIVYKTAAEKMNGKSFTIRTMDIGGDKLSSQLNIAKEANPNLGLRGIRLTLRHPSIFQSQLKAILRASVYGKFKLMFPMISGVQELKEALKAVENCKKLLDRDNIPYDKDLHIGVMIEVPSAVLVADELAKLSDFFSIGTNDLVQYALAVDRNSENVAEYYNPYNPAVIRMLSMIAKSAKKANIPISICGEIASERLFLPILIGLDIHQLSISPNFTLKTKFEISKTSYEECKIIAEKVLTLDSETEIIEYLRQWSARYES
jgi:phosphotransferase system enzyme I (PtsI)